MLLSIFIIITLNSLINCMPPFHLALVLESSLVLSFGVCFFVFPLWLLLCICFYALGRSTKILVQAFVSHSLWMALDRLFGAIIDLQHMTFSAEPECVQKEPGCTLRLAFTRLGEGQLKPQSSQKSAFAWRLSVRLSLGISLQLYS